MKALGLLLLAALCLYGCSSAEPESPEAQIRAVIEQIEQAAEERNRRGISEHISERYQDEQGRSRDDVENILRAYLFRNANINLFITLHSMTPLSPQEYRVELSVAMAGKSVPAATEASRLKADWQRFALLFVDESAGDGEWKVSRAERLN